MPRNPAEEVYADTPLSQLIAAHKDMQAAVDQADDDDLIHRVNDTMMALEPVIAARVPGSKEDAVSQLEWLITLFPDDHYSVLRRALASLIVWAGTLP